MLLPTGSFQYILCVSHILRRDQTGDWKSAFSTLNFAISYKNSGISCKKQARF